jgi:hypothetical protein
MGHYAKVENGLVTDVVVADESFISTGALGDPTSWVQTSYNTRGGIHYVPNSNPPEPSEDQSQALRANYAGIGYTYDSVNDVFYAPQPYPSWTIGPTDWIWQPPVPYPTDGGTYTWDEATQSWVPVEPVV